MLITLHGTCVVSPCLNLNAVLILPCACIPRSGSHDRSIRRWERTQEPFFVEEEREKRLDSMFEADMERSAPDGQQEQEAAAKEAAEGGVAPAGVRGEWRLQV